ncbi:SpoIIE family protein phosphatase [Streptomyces sp. TRM66268-LWL]|uniref:SpoIIE family protein phosphatase n=1 Tax=Streptomyces polyasparticus TaxID=2767826 RepID=A0ABR7SNF9_9ACTN|nr:SpoIIE family protein phosphatase [Streptomyces polyasparticus]MBC9716230.1 SpoIIE family protein phosphatase [Streptomyces polyasparticus]
MHFPELLRSRTVGSIPMQRENTFRPAGTTGPVPLRSAEDTRASTSLPGNPLAPAAARRFVRAAFAGWAESGVSAAACLTERLTDDAVVLVSELVTNAVVHAGTHVEVLCRLDAGVAADGDLEDGAAVVIEVCDHHPGRAVQGELGGPPQGLVEYGRGLQLVACLSESWGITYRPGKKTVWARLPVDGADAARQIEAYAGEQALQRGLRVADILAPQPKKAREQGDWGNRGALAFLAEASDLLAGQLDEEMVAALAGQLLVPRLADWCAVWLNDEADRHGRGTGPTAPRLARVWHHNESRIEDLRRVLEKDAPAIPGPLHGGPVPVPWPFEGIGDTTGTAVAYRLVAGGRALGTLLLGRAGLMRFPDEVTGLLEDFSRRVALAIGAARQYARQATISRVLQRGLLPSSMAEVPGVESALVYEPRDNGLAGGDFYDIFPAGDGRWCFALGDVCGNGPEAAVVTGLARPWLRLLAREGYQVSDVLDRLNRLLLDDATEAADSAARALAEAGRRDLAPDGSPARFLSLLYGELEPSPEGVRCTLACAGHPLPLLLGPDGAVRAAAGPQVLLGVLDEPEYESESFVLGSGETLVCVTDGVTERRSGLRMLDDGDGLARALAGSGGLSATVVAERIRRLVHDFAQTPVDDDLAVLVLQAR